MHSSWNSVFALIWILLSSVSSFAEYDDHCLDAGDVAHFLCTEKIFKRYDARLNNIYNKKRAELKKNKTELHKFVESEKAWIEAKEDKCRQLVEDMSVIGRTADIVFNDCEIEETVKRIAAPELSK